eukprot:1039922-Prymnesium_polylepis.2
MFGVKWRVSRRGARAIYELERGRVCARTDYTSQEDDVHHQLHLFKSITFSSEGEPATSTFEGMRLWAMLETRIQGHQFTRRRRVRTGGCPGLRHAWSRRHAPHTSYSARP